MATKEEFRSRYGEDVRAGAALPGISWQDHNHSTAGSLEGGRRGERKRWRRENGQFSRRWMRGKERREGNRGGFQDLTMAQLVSYPGLHWGPPEVVWWDTASSNFDPSESLYQDSPDRRIALFKSWVVFRAGLACGPYAIWAASHK